MRTPLLAALLTLPLLAACGGDAPQQQQQSAAPASKPAVTTPATRPATPATFPITARPMLGTWATDAAQCSAGAVTEVTATRYTSSGSSCDLKLTANKDGSFSATCEGQQLTLTPIFGPPGEGIRIASGDAKPVNVFRCGGR